MGDKIKAESLRAQAEAFEALKAQGDENLIKKFEDAVGEFSEKVEVSELIAGLQEIIEG